MNTTMWGFISLDPALLRVILLQYVAVIGIFSTLLMLSRDAQRQITSRKMLLGVILGVSNFALIVLASQFMQSSAKLFLSNDLLFLAGLLGGWWGGSVCLVLVALARVYFADTLHLGEALFSFSMMSMGGILLHHWFETRNLGQFTAKDIAWVLLVRFCAAIVPIQVVDWLHTVDTTTNAQILSFRLSSTLCSLPMIALMLAMLRREALYQEAQHARLNQAVTDSTTGLPNRRALGTYLENLLQQPPCGYHSHTLVVIKITNLKDLVAIHGHDRSDQLLVALVHQFKHGTSSELIRQFQPRLFMFSDLSLAIALPQLSINCLEQSVLIPSLQQTLREHLQNEGGLAPKLQFCVIDAQAGASAAITLRNISLALQDATQGVRYLRQSLIEKAQSNEQIRQQLMEWIEQGNPPMHYQPKFCLATRRVVGAEALLRARSEHGAVISPLYVLDVARRHELLQAFEWATIDATIRDVRAYLQAGLAGSLAVNISASSLGTKDFATQLIERLKKASIPGNRLSLELTENSPLPDTQQVAYNMLLLKDHGVQLALDDFGTGYAALSILAKYPFSEVKIDHSMTSQLHYERMRTAVSIALESARLYGASLTAEGVETEEQMAILKNIGITCIQGYAFSEAVPLPDLIKLGLRQLPRL